MPDTDASQPSEVNSTLREAMTRGTGGWEIAATPAIFGLLGWVVDGALGIRPLLTIAFAIIGLAGAVANQFYRYTSRMEETTSARKAAFEASYQEQFGEVAKRRFGATEQVDLPSYVVESELA